jgi:DNA-binding PucR family transcriptional regulator
VHVNTLRHRMMRMSEVAPLRLDDPIERLALRIQLAAGSGERQSAQMLSW